jgi:hypothetical protein
MGQKGFFDVERRLEAISAKGDPLETIKKMYRSVQIEAGLKAKGFQSRILDPLRQRKIVATDFGGCLELVRRRATASAQRRSPAGFTSSPAGRLPAPRRRRPTRFSSHKDILNWRSPAEASSVAYSNATGRARCDADAETPYRGFFRHCREHQLSAVTALIENWE